MLLSLRKNGLTSLFKEVRVFKVGAEIWEGDERRRFQFIESGDSLNGRNLFTELPFL